MAEEKRNDRERREGLETKMDKSVDRDLAAQPIPQRKREIVASHPIPPKTPKQPIPQRRRETGTSQPIPPPRTTPKGNPKKK